MCLQLYHQVAPSFYLSYRFRAQPFEQTVLNHVYMAMMLLWDCRVPCDAPTRGQKSILGDGEVFYTSSLLRATKI